MTFKNLKKIPEIDSYTYYRLQRKVSLLIREKRAETEDWNPEEDPLVSKEKEEDRDRERTPLREPWASEKESSQSEEGSTNTFPKDLHKVLKKQFHYSFGRRKVSGRLLCQEKHVLRLISPSRSLGILNKQDRKKFAPKAEVGPLNKNLQEFNVLKTFASLKTETALFSHTQTRIKFRFQAIQELERNYVRLRVRPKRWIPNKGMMADSLQGYLFIPYSKTPFRFKNKKADFGLYPTRLKEYHYEPAPPGLLRFFLLADVKRQIWLLQTKNFQRNVQTYGIIHRYRYPYAFSVGVNGVPVLLHRNQLFLSCRQMKKARGLFRFRSLFVFNVFARYISEKRTNVEIAKIFKFPREKRLKKLSHLLLQRQK